MILKRHIQTRIEKNKKNTELQHALEKFKRKIEVRTDDVVEKRRRIERQHEEVKNDSIH